MTASLTGLARFEFAALHILHACPFVEVSRRQIAFHDFEVDVPFAAFSEGFEHAVEQCKPYTSALGAGMNHEIADESTGPALRDSNHSQRVCYDNA
jgi:hypothetical protein